MSPTAQLALVAALHEVRARTPRECDNGCAEETRSPAAPWHAIRNHSMRCDERWTSRVDARVATCVEAGWVAAIPKSFTPIHYARALNEALAAFLAAAAQKETT